MRIKWLLLILSSAAWAQDVQTVPMVKNPPPDKAGMPLLVTVYPNAVYTCPKGAKMYLQNVRTKVVPRGIPDSNYLIWFPAPEGQIVTSGGDKQYKGMCLKD